MKSNPRRLVINTEKVLASAHFQLKLWVFGIRESVDREADIDHLIGW